MIVMMMLMTLVDDHGDDDGDYLLDDDHHDDDDDDGGLPTVKGGTPQPLITLRSPPGGRFRSTFVIIIINIIFIILGCS